MKRIVPGALVAVLGLVAALYATRSEPPPPERVAARAVEGAFREPEAPRWSSDGRWLAFESLGRIWVARPGGEARPVSSAPETHGHFRAGLYARDPAWMPSGSLAFVSARERVVGTFPNRPQRRRILVPDGPQRAHAPSPSRDGAVLTFVGDGDVWAHTPDRTGPLSTTHTVEWAPATHPDGRRVAFHRTGVDADAWNDGDVIVHDLGTGHEEVLAGGPADQIRPVWVGTDALAWFSTAPSASWDLELRQADGSVRTVGRDVALPSRGGAGTLGGWIAWVPAALDRDGDVHLHHAAEGVTRVVPTGLVEARDPAITARDGRTLLAVTGRPERNAPRRLVVVDVTDALAPYRP